MGGFGFIAPEDCAAFSVDCEVDDCRRATVALVMVEQDLAGVVLVPRRRGARGAPDRSAGAGMTLADVDRDESRSAMLAADRDNEPHPEDCRCWPCVSDRADVGEEW